MASIDIRATEAGTKFKDTETGDVLTFVGVPTGGPQFEIEGMDEPFNLFQLEDEEFYEKYGDEIVLLEDMEE